MKRSPLRRRTPLRSRGWLRQGQPLKRSATSLRRVGRTRRGREQRILPLMRQLLVQEYCLAMPGIPRATIEGLELDHWQGRNAPGFRLGAMLDPLNLQLITAEQHRLKTSATEETTAATGIHQRTDFRSDAIKQRLLALGGRLWCWMGASPSWTLKELKAAIRKELALGKRQEPQVP